MGIVQDITEQREISKSIYKAQQDERSRIARDIHDGIGQMLVAAKFKLSSMDAIVPEKLEGQKEEIEDMLATTLEEIRRVSRNLANRHLEDFGLEKTLAYFVEEIQIVGDFDLTSRIDLPGEYDLELSNTIYRVAQEAVSNVIKYARAKNVSINVETTNENIILEVIDDGIGFDTEINWNGIKNMKERTSLQNGHFDLALAYRQERDLDFVVARLFNTVGPRQSGQYGMVVARFVQAAVTGAALAVHGDGTQTRTFCHVRDTIRALKGLMDSDATTGEIFNVGSRNWISIGELAERVIELTGSSSELVRIPYDKVYGGGIDDMLHRVPAIDKIRERIGWEPTQSLDDILADVIAYERDALVA
jgi:hypothetical protein